LDDLARLLKLHGIDTDVPEKSPKAEEQNLEAKNVEVVESEAVCPESGKWPGK